MKKKHTNQISTMHKNADKDHLLEKVASIGRRMDSVEEIVGCLADADDKVKAKMLAKFGRGQVRAQVYLAINGIRDAHEIAKLVGTQRQNVDAEIRTLMKKRLIDVVEKNGRGTIYRKRSIDAITGLSDDVINKFNLDVDGRRRR